MRQRRVAVWETSIWLWEMSSASHADILSKKEWRAQCDACWETDRQDWLKNEMDWWVNRRIMIQRESGFRHVFLLYQTKAERMHWREWGGKKHIQTSFFLAALLHVCVGISDAIVSLSLCAYIHACHSQYVRAMCTFALLRSSPEVVL